MSGAASGDGISVVTVERLDLRFVPRPWRFAIERRHEIDAFFAERQKARTGTWNGRVLLMHDFSIARGTFRGEFFETDYAAFHAWCQWGFPDRSAINCFAAGALCSADGAFLLGEMGRHTANAGDIYFPCGTPDPSDVAGSVVDFAGSVSRELHEEVGLAEDDYVADPGWFIVRDGPRVALVKTLRAHGSAAELRRRIETHLAGEEKAELAGIHMVRSPADFDTRIAPFVTAFLAHVWSAQ